MMVGFPRLVTVVYGWASCGLWMGWETVDDGCASWAGDWIISGLLWLTTVDGLVGFIGF